MIEALRRQFAFDDWANRQVVGILTGTAAPARAVELQGHIVAAEYLWLDRIYGRSGRVAVWPEIAAGELASHLDVLLVEWSAFFEHLAPGDLERIVPYRNSKGETWSSATEDILTHVVMHGVYHRGQIAAVMRSAGLTPAYTDWIHATRQGFV